MSGGPSVSQAVEQQSCTTCGESLAGRYCAHCGQRVVGRHTLWRVFFHPVVSALGYTDGPDSSFRLERGFLYAVYRLTVAPGHMLREYLAGRTVSYVHPVIYLFASFAAFALMVRWTEFVTGAGDHRDFILFGILFVAGVSRLVFYRARLNYAEHLIIDMFLFGHVTFLLTLLQIPIHLAGATGTAVLGVVLGVCVAYFAWAHSRFFERHPSLAVGGALVSLLGGIALWMFAVGAILQVLRARGII